MNSEQMVQVLGTVAMEPKGDYSSEVYYEKLNVVSYNGSTYIAKQPSLGIPPTNSNYWQFISSSGLSETDVIDSLDSTDATKVLSAKQGNELGKSKIQFYNTVSEINQSTTLRDGMTVQTLGYYQINDNGGAEYYITTSEPQTGYYEEISTGIYATLLIDDRINFKQLGAKTYEEDPTFDNKNIIDKYISICDAYDKTFELFIPGGRWCFSETLMNRPKGVRITGDKTWAYADIYGSAILPLNDNQQYLWKLGGLADYTDYSTSISVAQMVKSSFIDGLCFTTVNGAGDTRYSVSQGVFILDRAEFITLDNIYLWKFSGNGLVITSSWEIDIGLLSIRQHKNPLTYSIVFDKTKPVGNVSVNISALTIDKLYFERNDNYIISQQSSGFSHNHINYINVETKFTSIDNTWDTTTSSQEEINEATEVHIFRGFCRYFTIGTMNIVFNDSNLGIIVDNQKYYMKSIICDDYSLISGISARNRQFNIDVAQLSVRYGTANSEMSVIKSRNMAQLAHIHIGTLSCEDNIPKILIDAYQSGNIRIGSFSSDGNAYNQGDVVTDFEPAYKHTFTMISNGLVTYMENAPSEYHLVAYKEASPTNASGIRFKYYGISDSTNTQTLKMLCKNLTENALTFKVRFVQNGVANDITSPSLPADGNWHILEMPFWADFGSIINFLEYGGNKAFAGFKID